MRKAQSVLEYVLVMTVIIMAILFATREDGPLRKGLNSYFDGMGSAITNVVDAF